MIHRASVTRKVETKTEVISLDVANGITSTSLHQGASVTGKVKTETEVISLDVANGITSTSLHHGAFVPEDSTDGYIVIALTVRLSDRSQAYIKKFCSKSGGWDCSAVKCTFSFPEISSLRIGSVLSGGYISIAIPSTQLISISIDNLTIRAFPFPEPDIPAMALRRHQIICRTRNGDLCLAVVRAEAATAGKHRRVISIFRFSWLSHDWELKYEWPDPRRVPCLNLIGFAEGQGSVLVGTGWDSVFALDIESGRLSQEMQDTGAGDDILACKTEYPSTGWWEFSG